MKLSTLITLYAVSLLILSGCSNSNPTPKKEAIVDDSLPIVELTKNGLFVDMKSIAFEWNIVSDPKVKGIYIYKTTPDTEEKKGTLEYYTTINSRFSTHYIDRSVTPATKYAYAFKTFSEVAEGRQSKLISVSSLPVLNSVVWVHSQTGMPRTAKILWRPHTNERVKSYIIERKTFEDKEWKELAKLNGLLNAEYIDTELKDNYVYEYRIRVETYDGIVSSPSEIVKVVTKALPKGVSKIKTTTSLAKSIKITWDESIAKDFALYYLYRSEKVDGDYELIATLHNSNFLDKINDDGKKYFYRVSVVDKDGLESEHDEVSVQGMSLEKPDAPSVVQIKLIDKTIKLFWSKVDLRTKSYIVVKKQKKGWFDESVEEFSGIEKREFIDTKIENDTLYSYRVYAVDVNGIKSLSSVEVKLQTPESTEIIMKEKTSTQQAIQKEVAAPSLKSKSEVEVISPMTDLNVKEL